MNPPLIPDTCTDIEVDLQRRNLLRLGAGAGIVVLSAGFTTPQCGVSKEEAARIIKLVIGVAKQAPPLLNLLGAKDIAITFEAKVIPALEKLEDALDEVDIPDAKSLLENVRNTLSLVDKALASLPSSPRLITIMGIIASARVLLLTVEAFIDSEMPAAATAGVITGDRRAAMTSAIKKAAEAVR